MKCVILLLVAVVALASAEPPRYRFRSQQQQAPPAAEPAPYPAASGPYPPSGTKPNGPLFRLPERQQNPPQTYAAPTNAPATTTESAETTTTAAGRTPKSSRLTASEDTETVDTKDSDSEEGTDANAAPQGVYYIYHPNGLLQRVVFTAGEDGQSAQLRYENVEPIRGPIFTYDPNTLQLQPVDVSGQFQQQQ